MQTFYVLEMHHFLGYQTELTELTELPTFRVSGTLPFRVKPQCTAWSCMRCYRDAVILLHNFNIIMLNFNITMLNFESHSERR